MPRGPSNAPQAKLSKPVSIYAAGGISLALYLLTAFFYRQGFQVPSQTEREVFAWVCIVPLLVFYWWGYQAASRMTASEGLAAVAGMAAALGVAAFLIFPFHSEDLFVYVNTGWQQAHYGQNPYASVVTDLAAWRQDPMFWKSIWVRAPASYGFLFTLLTRRLAELGGGHWLKTVYLFKLVNLGAFFATAWLVWKGALRSGLARPVAALYLFAWNPLILMQEVANGHNDMLAGCLIAGAAYMAVVGADFWVIPALTMAAMIKDVPAVMIPFALLLVAKRRGWRTVSWSCAVAALMALFPGLFYLREWRQFRVSAIVSNITVPEGSLHALLLELFKDAARIVPALQPAYGAVNTAIGAALGIGFLILFVVLLARMRRHILGTGASSAMSPAQLASEFIEASLLTLTVLLCVVDGRFEAWYLGMLLPAALFLEETHWLRRLVVALSIGELFALTFLRSAFVINYIAMAIVPAWIVFAQERKKRLATAGGRGAAPQET